MSALMMSKNRRLLRTVRWLGVATLGGMLALGGCGRGTVSVVPVRGVVTLDGTPVEEAYLTFQPVNGRPSVGKTNEDGRYELAFTGKRPGALVGLHRVAIKTRQDAMPDLGIAGVPERIPERYNTKSQLEVEVTRDRKAYDFKLLSTPPSTKKGN